MEPEIRSTADSNLNVHSFENTEQIFFELASEQRLSIMFRLMADDQRNNTANLSKLAKDLNVTIQEAHRNVNRLMDSGLIEKNSQGLFFLTTFGKTIIKQILTFDFLSRNKEYFSEHTLGKETPMKFIQRIGALNNCELIQGIVAVIETLKQRLYKESIEYIYGMLPQIPLDLIEAVIPKIRDDRIKFHYILPQKAVVPKKRIDLLKNAGFYELLDKKKRQKEEEGVAYEGPIQRRMINKINVAIILNEKQAAVMFPTLKGDIDMNSMFYSVDPLFHEWCLDYFRYWWYNSRTFDESKLLEV